MRNLFFSCLLTVPIFISAQTSHGYPITQVPFTDVSVTGGFWGQRLQAAREVTLPLAFAKCEQTGRYTNFEKAANPSPLHQAPGFPFDDTDVYKTIEGASYTLQTHSDSGMVAYIDSVLNIVSAAQEPDGYLYTARTMNPDKPHEWIGNKRWEKVEDLSHELYNLGHMLEAAVAHYQATGSRKFLDIATRFANCVYNEVGPGPGQATVVPGHQIAEMGLCKLYLVTGDSKYLDLAKYMLDYRGKTRVKNQYAQSHMPVLEQREAVGHAVRAAYMYAGMADVAALTGDTAYVTAIDSIWWNIVSKKLYITGGIGATSQGEAFGKEYELPNLTAYCETCAAIGNVYVNHRLFLLHGESKYYDVLERTLYNGLISGVSLDGGAFFYPNPLASTGQHKRQPWFGCACCPSNISRFIPSLPGYVYAVKEDNIYVNLYLSNTAKLSVDGKVVNLEQETQYPWNGDISVRVTTNKAGQWAMKLRVPGWAVGQVVPSDLYAFADNKQGGFSVLVNGTPAQGTLTSDGYYTISRRWKAGDEVSLCLDMEPRIVSANPLVEADKDMVAVTRGPLVYCAEWADNDFDIFTALLNQYPDFGLENDYIHATEYKKASYPVIKLTTPVQLLSYGEDGCLRLTDSVLTLIPYYAWCHRGRGKMRLWLPSRLTITNVN